MHTHEAELLVYERLIKSLHQTDEISKTGATISLDSVDVAFRCQFWVLTQLA